MAKTYLVNLTEAEIDALTCDYLFKGCASKIHHDDTIFALSKLLKTRNKVNQLEDAKGVDSESSRPSENGTVPEANPS